MVNEILWFLRDLDIVGRGLARFYVVPLHRDRPLAQVTRLVLRDGQGTPLAHRHRARDVHLLLATRIPGLGRGEPQGHIFRGRFQRDIDSARIGPAFQLAVARRKDIRGRNLVGRKRRALVVRHREAEFQRAACWTVIVLMIAGASLRDAIKFPERELVVVFSLTPMKRIPCAKAMFSNIPDCEDI